MILGLLTAIAGIVLIVMNKSIALKGMAIPLILVGIIHFIVGFNVYKKSDQQRTDMVYAFDLDPNKIKQEELPRMEAVKKNFVVLRLTEIALFMAGLAIVFVFRSNPDQLFWYGFGLALSIEAFVSLVLDFFAEKRANEYFQALKLFT